MAGQHQRQQPGTPVGVGTWVAEPCVLGLSSAAFSDTLTGSCVGSRTAEMSVSTQEVA